MTYTVLNGLHGYFSGGPPIFVWGYHCLAFQTLFRVVAPSGGLDRSVDITDIPLTLRPDYLVSSPFTHGPLESWATGLISYSWIHTSYPLLTRDGYIFLYRLHPSSGIYYRLNCRLIASSSIVSVSSRACKYKSIIFFSP